MFGAQKFKVAVFIDWMNCHFSDSRGNPTIDIPKLRAFLESLGTIKCAHAFPINLGKRTPSGKDKRSPLRKKLQADGFVVREKRLYSYVDADKGQRITKGNMDVELVIDAMDFL